MNLNEFRGKVDLLLGLEVDEDNSRFYRIHNSDGETIALVSKDVANSFQVAHPELLSKDKVAILLNLVLEFAYTDIHARDECLYTIELKQTVSGMRVFLGSNPNVVVYAPYSTTMSHWTVITGLTERELKKAYHVY